MPQHSGRIQRILSTSAPLTIIIPSKSLDHTLSAALRIVHDLDAYLRLDSEIIDDDEAMQRLQTNALGQGNIVVLGGPQSRFFEHIIQQKKTPVSIAKGVLSIGGRPIDEPSTASLFLHPHPTHEDSLMLMIYSTDENALERAIKLFPIRTGVNIPDWIVVGSNSDDLGAGDVRGAG